jgi:hypothetical protein
MPVVYIIGVVETQVRLQNPTFFVFTDERSEMESLENEASPQEIAHVTDI